MRLQRRNRSGWLCLLASAWHLLAPLGHASRYLPADNAGHLLTVYETGHAAATIGYTYDELGRVKSETSHGVTHFYEYDLAGNRIRAQYATGRVVETSYDGLNRPEVIAEGGRATRYGYDLGGRAVLMVSANGQTSQNTYDALGRLEDRTLFKTPAMNNSEVLAEFSWRLKNDARHSVHAFDWDP